MMATLNAVSRPPSFDTTTADHVTTVVGDTATNTVDDTDKVYVVLAHLQYVRMRT